MNPKGAFLAFTCVLIAGLCNATADELLDLETRDLAEMKTVSGITVVFDPGKISMVYTLPRSSGSSSSRSGSITNILGLSGGPQEVSETADRGIAMILVLISILTIIVVGAICFWAIDRFATDRRLANLLKLLVILICLGAILQRVLPMTGIY